MGGCRRKNAVGVQITSSKKNSEFRLQDVTGELDQEIALRADSLKILRGRKPGIELALTDEFARVALRNLGSRKSSGVLGVEERGYGLAFARDGIETFAVYGDDKSTRSLLRDPNADGVLVGTLAGDGTASVVVNNRKKEVNALPPGN